MCVMCSKILRFNLHDVQLVLHRKDRNKGSKNVFHQNQLRFGDGPPYQVAAWKNQLVHGKGIGTGRGIPCRDGEEHI